MFGIEVGNVLFDVIDSVQDFCYVKQLVVNGWLDIGDEFIWLLLNYLVLVVIFEDQVNVLKVFVEVLSLVDEFEVRKLCWFDDGEWVL